MYHWQIRFPILGVYFQFVDSFLFLCKSFLVWYSFISLFFILFPLSEQIHQKKYCYEKCPRFYCLCFLLGFSWFQILHLSLYFVLILEYDVRRQSNFNFCAYLSNILDTIYHIDCVYLIIVCYYVIVCYYFLCQILTDQNVWVCFGVLYSVTLKCSFSCLVYILHKSYYSHINY